MAKKKDYVTRSYGKYNTAQQSAKYFRGLGHKVSKRPYEMIHEKRKVWAINISKEKVKSVV